MSTDSDITSTVLILSAFVALLMKIVSISSCTAYFLKKREEISLSAYRCHIILFGNRDLTLIANRMIMEATINYIKAAKRLVQVNKAASLSQHLL